MNVLSSKTPVAKKVHQCEYCYGFIEPGQKYSYAFIVDGSDRWAWKSHESCNLLADKLEMHKYMDGEGLTGDDFCEFVRAEYSNLTGKASVSLLFGTILYHVKKHHQVYEL